MRALVLAGVLTLGLVSAAPANPETTDPARVPPGVYELDPRHASLIVRVVHMGFSHYTMRFRTIAGSFTYDPADWQHTKVDISVDPKSIDTAESAFNRTVAGYFDPDRFPVIAFTGNGLKPTGDAEGELAGDLTFHGVTRPVTLNVTFNGAGPGLFGMGVRLGFTGTGRIKRSEFHGTGGRPFAGDDVDLVFDVEFVKK